MSSEVRLPVPGRRKPEWPSSGLNVRQLRTRGWQPVAFRQFVLKVASRCNLACGNCYVYELADQSWRAQPVRMDRRTLTMAAARIVEHARRHDLPGVTVVLHGGEPLLLGHRRVGEVAATLRDAVRGLPIELELLVQTNGTLLDEAMLGVLAQAEVRVGISLDGVATDHDRRRPHADGRGSHAEVVAALRRLRQPRYRHLFAGILCTVDLDQDPVATYQHLMSFDPPVIDLLLPHGNWSHPPAGRLPGSEDTPYADWLISVFNAYYRSTRRTAGIRLFDEIMSLVLGGQSLNELIGLSPVGLLVIETDGTLQQVDSLKSTYEGAAATGLNVMDNALDEALLHPGIIARQIGVEALSSTCIDCHVRDYCGGGHYAHRYRHGSGFKNPSVYCPDLFALVRHVRNRVLADAATVLPP